MSDLVVIVYPSEAKAEEMRTKLLELQNEYLIDIRDAVIAVRREDGKVKLNQLMNTTAAGAISGGFWGTLVGLIFLMPLLGAAVGVASGALGGALADFGINDDFMKKLATKLTPGSAALFVEIRKMTQDKVLEAIKGTGGELLQTSLNHTKEQALREAISAHVPPAAETSTPPPSPNPSPSI
ncbi:DUF1269 domain-containing protein [Hyphomicrobium sp.]|uniref:DUF1269 domain-containing protein n=1 Tax=Hyphomicrobium sp. TaxID=82 RepID=UPI002D7651E0|nr:DUF1269 domain-containing protein [Hyphomicrobium sp.]HET6389902.1 DUF1269 domain-containing protein [Hyphomicrobium sp.]